MPMVHHRPDPNAPPPDASAPPHFDHVLGIVIMSLGGVIALLNILVLAGVDMLTQWISRVDATTPKADIDSAHKILILLAAGEAFLALLNIVAGYGIMHGRKWGYICGVVFNCLTLIIALVGASCFSEIAMILYLGIIIYSGMRLSGKAGPLPT